MTFWEQYWHVIAFYTLVAITIYLNRNKFEFEAKFIGLLRTNTGVEWMNKHGKKYAHIYKPLSHIGIYVGFIGMIIILGYLFYGAYQLVAVPNAAPVVSPVLPGAAIPGTGITIPLIAGLLALFIVVAVHEAGHGVVSAAHNIPVKHSGVGFFGPIPVAFVEPNEEKISKAPDKTQLRIFAAGPWVNVLQAILAIGLFIAIGAALTPLTSTQGIQFSQIQENSPAAQAGLDANTPYTTINGEEITSPQHFLSYFSNASPHDQILLDDKRITLGENQEEKACIGVVGIQAALTEEDFRKATPLLARGIQFIQETIYWVFVLALGLGLANLLPLGPVDGGRMIHLPLVAWLGKTKGEAVWAWTAKILLGLLLILLLVPIIKAVAGPSTAQALSTCFTV